MGTGLPQDITLLVVDDEEHLRESLTFDLKRRGFNVLCAENGRNAYDLFVQNKVDLVISDIRMPGGDGVELLSRLRALDKVWPPIILLTGYSNGVDNDLIALGANQIIAKPFEPADLLSQVYLLTRTSAVPKAK